MNANMKISLLLIYTIHTKKLKITYNLLRHVWAKKIDNSIDESLKIVNTSI